MPGMIFKEIMHFSVYDLYGSNLAQETLPQGSWNLQFLSFYSRISWGYIEIILVIVEKELKSNIHKFLKVNAPEAI